MEQRVQPEECFWSMAGSTVQPRQAVCTEAELFSSSHREGVGNGILGRCILFTDNPTGVFRTERCFALRVKSTGPLIMVVKTASVLFTNCRPDRMTLGHGMEE